MLVPAKALRMNKRLRRSEDRRTLFHVLRTTRALGSDLRAHVNTPSQMEFELYYTGGSIIFQNRLFNGMRSESGLRDARLATRDFRQPLAVTSGTTWPALQPAGLSLSD
jgi:hypothetical protein